MKCSFASEPGAKCDRPLCQKCNPQGVHRLASTSAEEIVLEGRINARNGRLELTSDPEILNALTPGEYVVKVRAVKRPALCFPTHRQAIIDSRQRDAFVSVDGLGRYWSVPNERVGEPGIYNDFKPQDPTTKGR